MSTLNVNFKSPSKAAEFAKNFGVVGLKATAKVDGSVVVVTSPDAKTHDFVKQMVADLKSEAKMESTMSRFLSSIIEASIHGEIVEVNLLDGSTVSIHPKFADKFIKVHDSMCEDTGQGLLRSLAVESADSFTKTMKFVAEDQE